MCITRPKLSFSVRKIGTMTSVDGVGITLSAFALMMPLFFFTVYDERQSICWYDFNQINEKKHVLLIVWIRGGFSPICDMLLLLGNYQGILLWELKSWRERTPARQKKSCEVVASDNLGFHHRFYSSRRLFPLYSSDRGPFHRVSLFLLNCNPATNPVFLGFQNQNFITEFKNIVSETISKIERVIRFVVD